MRPVTVAAADLGAASGRVMVGRVGPGELSLAEAHRFANEPVPILGTLHWDVLALHRGVLMGLRAAGRLAGGLDAVGVDTWAVDYGLLDYAGALLGNPVHYRDGRTDGVPAAVLADLPAGELYAITGLQQLPFNTVYQLTAALGSPQLDAARRLLLMPDLLSYWLTGAERAELTNASTTQLLDVRQRAWSAELIRRLGLDPGLFAQLCEPGDRIGDLLPAVLDATGLAGPVPLLAVGSHDTASAVVGVPASGERFAYISSGTWSLVGVELDEPVLTEESRRANFTNELGVDGTVRYLRNVAGLWLLQECVRAWGDLDQDALLREAAALPAFGAVVDVDDPAFLPPGDMPARIAVACVRLGQPEPASRAATVRCILDSLALAYRRTIAEARQLSGRDVEVIHVVGGGARNALLCQLTADACGLPVMAGPVEATALGNVLVQARALGAVHGGLPELRALIRDTQQLCRYEPAGDRAGWHAAERRLAA
jgi:rhamnulokinase